MLILKFLFFFSYFLLSFTENVHLSKEPTVRIQCLSGFMIIKIDDAPLNNDGYFSGMVYPKGLSKNSTCLTEYRDHKGSLKYKLPLRSCNTMPMESVRYL